MPYYCLELSCDQLISLGEYCSLHQTITSPEESKPTNSTKYLILIALSLVIAYYCWTYSRINHD
jgi:hypothetical protein